MSSGVLTPGTVATVGREGKKVARMPGARGAPLASGVVHVYIGARSGLGGAGCQGFGLM
jgi:hypothetical protein